LAELGVAPSPQLLEILAYDCGLILGRALISTKNPIFEKGSRKIMAPNADRGPKDRFPASRRAIVFSPE
jgi:hypothetical protein